MNKEFVSYEQALALKELGFDEPCFRAYGAWGLMSSNDVNSLSDEVIQEDLDDKGYNEEDGVCLAPTYSQAFRWFREKYQMIHQIYSLKYKGGVNYDYEIFSLVLPTDDELGNEDDVATDKSMETYDSLVDKNFKHDESETYPEAELECLKKLIEIVKS